MTQLGWGSSCCTGLEWMKQECRRGDVDMENVINILMEDPGEIENIALKESRLDQVDWRIEKIPRLTSSGTRRPLSVFFRNFSVSEAPEVSDLTSSRWVEGNKEGDRWNVDGACLKLKFSLPPGTYATVLMREFMKSPLDHY